MVDRTVIQKKPGEILEVTCDGPKASLYIINCGEYGKIYFTLPPGQSFQIEIGTIAPYIIRDDDHVYPFDDDNVIRLDKSD